MAVPIFVLGEGTNGSFAVIGGLILVRSFVSDNELAELCVTLQLRIPGFRRGVGLGLG